MHMLVDTFKFYNTFHMTSKALFGGSIVKCEINITHSEIKHRFESPDGAFDMLSHGRENKFESPDGAFEMLSRPCENKFIFSLISKVTTSKNVCYTLRIQKFTMGIMECQFDYEIFELKEFEYYNIYNDIISRFPILESCKVMHKFVLS